MATPAPTIPEPLPPETARRLAEFAKACKAATRIVSLYPPSHPTIQSALSRIVDSGTAAVADGPLRLTILPDALLIDGRGFARPEAAATELAVLLHEQQIGEMTLAGTLDTGEWHDFLSLLAKPPEEARALGGVTATWAASGRTSITLKEIDYAEVLRERRHGDPASWARILATLGVDPDSAEAAGDGPLNALLAMADDPQQLAHFSERLQEHGRANGDDALQQRKSLLEVMYGLANHAAEHTPAELEGVLNNMAGAAAQMSPEMLMSLITDPPPLSATEAGAPRIDLAGELHARLTDEMLTKFLVDNIVKDRGATSRLAAAFQTLVPDGDRQQSILAAATEQAAGLFGEDPQFESVWSSSTELLMSYSDTQYVSDDYARDLTTARNQAVSIDKIGDDPPTRIRAWVSTVSNEEVRGLDQHLLIDLLTIEKRPDAWASVLDSGITSIDQLVLVGDLTLAGQLVDVIVAIAKAGSGFSTQAAAGLTRLVDGSLVRHLTLFLRQATDAEVGLATHICRTIGPVLVKPLSDALAAEDHGRTVRRLRDILIGFGSDARRYADELRTSPNPAVRRAAVDLLRALGGEAALPDLRGLLDDTDQQVQREALRAIVQIGTTAAYGALEQALKTGQPHTRDAIMQALGSFRDERASPLFVYVLTHSGYKGGLEAAYVSSIESLGRVASDDRAVATLKDILHRGEWYAPGRTARIRGAAARALRGLGLPAADQVLAEAVLTGAGGVKRAARAALADPAPVRPARRAP
jgi:hypothetical protein